MKKADLKKLALDDLERSGLDNKDFLKMKLVLCDEDEASAILNSNFITYGYAIPYFNSAGKLIDSVRFKFLNELENSKGKIVKYSQPKGTEAKIYFSPCIKWKGILKDAKQPLVITEGEKKAYKACKEGIPTIGLGGVWSFKCKRLQKNLIDDFNEINLKDRIIYLCFDNDYKTNEDVMKALRALAKELNDKGAIVYHKSLPFNPYQKIGLDDYLLEHDKNDFDELEIEEFESLNAINALNDEVAYIKEVGKFYIIDSNLFVSPETLTKATYANRLIQDGEREVSVASPWLKSANRREHIRLTYKPGQPKITDDNEYNLWKGWGCEPERGNINAFMKAVHKVFNYEQNLINWFLDWVAYPVQNPGAKMLTGVLFQSIHQGTGKSSIGLCIGAMYGNNFRLIEDADLHSSFNEWAINKQFVLGDEISGKDKRGDSDKIKNLITRPSININKKYSPTYQIPDCINYLFTSNHPDALNIEPDDRRFFVYEIKKDSGLTLKEGQELERFRKGKGTAALLYYFAYEHKISKGFDYRARPPMTAAKAELIDHSLTDIERFLTHVRENPEHALMLNGAAIDRDLFTVSQVIQLYRRINDRQTVTLTAMGKALKKMLPDAVKKQVRTLKGSQALIPLRNFNFWANEDAKQWADHYDRSKIALFEAKQKKHKEGKQ